MNNIEFNYDVNYINGLTNELKAIYIYNFIKKKKNSILLVTPSLFEANKFYGILKNYDKNVLLYPVDDFLEEQFEATSPELAVNRLETLEELLTTKKSVVVTNLKGFLKKTPSASSFKKSFLKIDENSEISFSLLCEKLYDLGYSKETLVNKTGEFAIRGFVVDIFPISYDNPIRFEFWGDNIESIRDFDVDTQLTIKKRKECIIKPAKESVGNNTITNYMNNLVVFFNDYDQLESIYTKIIERDKNQSCDFLGVVKNKMHYIFDYNFKDSITYKARDVLPFSKNENEINLRLNKYIKSKKTVVVCLSSRYLCNQIIEKLKNSNIVFSGEDNLINNKVNAIVKNMSSGFEFNDYVYVTERELFGKKEKVRYKTKFKYGTKINDYTKLNPGDYVVHYIHGVGKYCGIISLNKKGILKDYLLIEYKDNDKLYIPASKIENIYKYSAKEGVIPKISKLNSNDWNKAKLKAQKRAESIASDLIQTAALRKMHEGFSFDKDSKEQKIFEDEFIYEETDDQRKVLIDIKKDMESPYPMDRLLCGDVGYGKTEVAFRAMFKAILSKKQVAMLCPTTILSTQHFANALERFKSFAVNIEVLNRFISQKKVKEILKKIKQGKVDILIGTHRILSEDVVFKDLGLLVIDEEQRFGVKQKEKIKQYRNKIDILTLSATPIPRTLQLSLSGVRSLSLIETPPSNRYPIQTYVVKENANIIKNAIYKELSREGQIFILYNRIYNMNDKLREFQKLVPEAKIAMIHGQMNKEEMENIMQDFIQMKYDVLLCTTIIETGIDIPSVNTLIIVDSDKFGLSQLYQIRGRIGRSDKIAYCYLMYNEKKILSEIAKKRLEVIKNFTELGSGFAIAMRDLSLRGSGDILGKEQAGFIESVGMEIFSQMVNEEIERLKGNCVENTQNTKKDNYVDVKTAISEKYIPEEELRIDLHKRINSITSVSDLKKVATEIEDRYGKMDDDLVIYMYEQLFEREVDLSPIYKINQSNNYIELILKEDYVKKINIGNLFIVLNKICPKIIYSTVFNKVHLKININQLDQHYIYYLLNIVEALKRQVN